MILFLAIAQIFLEPVEITVPTFKGTENPIAVSSVASVDLPPIDFSLNGVQQGSFQMIPIDELAGAMAHFDSLPVVQAWAIQMLPMGEIDAASAELNSFPVSGIEAARAILDRIAKSNVNDFPAQRWADIADVLPDALGRVTINGKPVNGGSAYYYRARNLEKRIISEGFSDSVMQEAAKLRLDVKK